MKYHFKLREALFDRTIDIKLQSNRKALYSDLLSYLSIMHNPNMLFSGNKYNCSALVTDAYVLVYYIHVYIYKYAYGE